VVIHVTELYAMMGYPVPSLKSPKASAVEKTFQKKSGITLLHHVSVVQKLFLV
jgi:hypothetical protein